MNNLITITDYLSASKYTIEQLFKLLNKIEQDYLNTQQNKSAVPMHRKTSDVFQKFAKQVQADCSEEESFDFIVRGIEHAKAAESKEEQVVQVLQVYNDALLMINNPLHSVAQAILQISKQGISSKYGSSKTDCENEFIKKDESLPTKYGVSLLDIMWEGRNQSIHYEDGTFNPSVTACFNSLLQNDDYYCQRLKGFQNRENKSFEIIKILGWNKYIDLEVDLLSLDL